MHIDIGAADGDEALERVRIGDSAVIAADPLPLEGRQLVSRSLDNRLGVYVALEATPPGARERRAEGRHGRGRRRSGGDRVARAR